MCNKRWSLKLRRNEGVCLPVQLGRAAGGSTRGLRPPASVWTHTGAGSAIVAQCQPARRHKLSARDPNKQVLRLRRPRPRPGPGPGPDNVRIAAALCASSPTLLSVGNPASARPRSRPPSSLIRAASGQTTNDVSGGPQAGAQTMGED